MSGRRLLIALAVIVALLVVADRVAVASADHVVAGRIQAEQGLDSRPSVSIHGFPFLTQAIGGTYTDVTLTMHDLRRGGVPVRTLSVRLRGVHVPLRAVLSQRLHSVPIDHATATVLITFADLNAFLDPRHLHVDAASGGRLRVTGSVTLLGRTLSASGTGRLDVKGDDVVVGVGHGLDFTIPLGSLPFRIVLVGAHATSQGVVVTATASGLVVHPRQ